MYIPIFQPEISKQYGYLVEEHEVVTKDGYILTIHHLLPKIKTPRTLTPVLLGHCLLGSSAIWIFGPKNNSLGYLLSDQNLDVWLINNRGNLYSSNHVRLVNDRNGKNWFRPKPKFRPS